MLSRTGRLGALLGLSPPADRAASVRRLVGYLAGEGMTTDTNVDDRSLLEYLVEPCSRRCRSYEAADPVEEGSGAPLAWQRPPVIIIPGTEGGQCDDDDDTGGPRRSVWPSRRR